MKISKKIISILLIATMLFSTLIISGNAVAFPHMDSISESCSERPAMTTQQFLSFVNPLNKLLKTLTGKEPFPSNFSITFSEGMALELCNYIRDNSALDIPELLEAIPLGTNGLEFFYDITDTDTTAIREELRALRRKCDEENKSTLSLIVYFFENYLSIMKNLNIYTIPVGDDGTTRVGITITRKDDSTLDIPVDVYFSPDGLAYGPDGKGILGLGFECSVYDLLIYATVNSWMRDYGFCLFYDIFCYVTPFFNYITRRFKFDYDGKEWMVQIWKGNYVCTNGAEVGIYNREMGSTGTYYNCYDGLMNMSLKLSYGDTLIFEKADSHWWINGFKLSKTLYTPHSMTMDFTIEMPDSEMANALAQAINDNYMHDVTCTVEENTVIAKW
ncbi:MAG: DUF4474 domain-containing protein [Ruminococcus sp.]|nr:DUF4474 domain-containing protein [Candidatus Copronaster equi]